MHDLECGESCTWGHGWALLICRLPLGHDGLHYSGEGWSLLYAGTSHWPTDFDEGGLNA